MKAPIITNPYCPPVGELSPKNSPFVVKRGEELPAEPKESLDRIIRKKGEDSQVDTGQDVPEPYKSRCRETGSSSGIPGSG